MKKNRIVFNAYKKILFCILGFHAFFAGIIFLFGQVLPKYCTNFPWVPFNFILYAFLLLILYYFRFTQVKLWKEFFSKLPHLPFEKYLQSLVKRFSFYYHLVESSVALFCIFYFLFMLILIVFMLFSSIITLLVEVYWLTDFSFFESQPFNPFLIFGAFFSEFILFLSGLLSTIKE